ncbi:MAG: hypothetical protein HYY16_11150 [Planctomycetes bacterium]|nr:hypothetical protein [Planctomycetota bacterium]
MMSFPASVLLLACLQDPAIDRLVMELGDEAVEVREGAQERLVEVGEAALAALRKAATADDPEVRARAAEAIVRIEWKGAEGKLADWLREHGARPEDCRRVKHVLIDKWLKDRRVYRCSWKKRDQSSEALIILSRNGNMAVQGDRQTVRNAMPSLLASCKATNEAERLEIAHMCLELIRELHGLSNSDRDLPQPPRELSGQPVALKFVSALSWASPEAWLLPSVAKDM